MELSENQIINQLAANADVFASCFSGLSHEALLWKEAEGKWCLLELLCHLVDEEVDDFRARTRHTLTEPENPLPAMDPEAWVTDRKYIQQDPEERLKKLLEERATSIDWLTSMENPDWTKTTLHTRLGPLSARFFLANWLAHDYLHLRQVMRIKHSYLSSQSAVNLQYAGAW